MVGLSGRPTKGGPPFRGASQLLPLLIEDFGGTAEVFCGHFETAGSAIDLAQIVE